MTGRAYKWTCQNCGKNFKEVTIEEFENSQGDAMGMVETKSFEGWECEVCGNIHEIETLERKSEHVDSFISGDDGQ